VLRRIRVLRSSGLGRRPKGPSTATKTTSNTLFNPAGTQNVQDVVGVRLGSSNLHVSQKPDPTVELCFIFKSNIRVCWTKTLPRMGLNSARFRFETTYTPHVLRRIRGRRPSLGLQWPGEAT
jgi:hypothetical protein